MSSHLNRRQLLARTAGGLGLVGLSTVLADAGLLSDAGLLAATPEPRPAAINPLAPKPPHYAPRATRLIFLFMNGGPSHVDTFDPKPELTKHAGETLPDSFAMKGSRRRTGK